MDDIVIDFMKDDEVNKVAELSYMVGKFHDDALPEYFNTTSKDEHYKIIENMKSNESAKILVARNKENVVGFACLFIQENEHSGYKVKKVGYIYNFGVMNKFRRKGVGKKLVESSVEFFKQNRCGAVDLNVFVFNAEALNFYKNSGFEMIDVNMRRYL